MPDLADQLRRYADAIEESLQSKELRQRTRTRQRRLLLTAASVAAVLGVVAMWASADEQDTATLDTAGEVDSGETESAGAGEEDGAAADAAGEDDRDATEAWQLERLGTLSAPLPSPPVWFSGYWWSASQERLLLRSADGLKWQQVEWPLPDDVAVTFAPLVTNDTNIMIAGAGSGGRVVAATSTDGSTWQTVEVGNPVTASGEVSVGPVAFRDGLGVTASAGIDTATTQLHVSNDGRSWEPASIPSAVLDTYIAVKGHALAGLDAEAGQLRVTLDGRSWEVVPGSLEITVTPTGLWLFGDDATMVRRGEAPGGDFEDTGVVGALGVTESGGVAAVLTWPESPTTSPRIAILEDGAVVTNVDAPTGVEIAHVSPGPSGSFLVLTTGALGEPAVEPSVFLLHRPTNK